VPDQRSGIDWRFFLSKIADRGHKNKVIEKKIIETEPPMLAVGFILILMKSNRAAGINHSEPIANRINACERFMIAPSTFTN
jgi:hypothetical protein